MKFSSVRLAFGALAIALVGAIASAQADVKIGVIYDYTGAFAAGGSKAAAIGNKIAIDLFNERGGVAGHKVVPINVDAQSKVDVAINEAERLLNDEKVDLLMGLFSSAQCVPLVTKVDAAKKFLWITVCVASAVFKDKNLHYVFRPQVHSDQFGEASCTFVAESTPTKLNKAAKDVKVAIIHEDGPYGAGIAATDLSALVTKLRRAQPDIVLHTGYNPDITLFLRQAKEAGLKFGVLIGHSAGYGQIDKLVETFKDDVNYVFNVGPVAAQLLDPKTLQPGLGELTAELVKRYKAETGAHEVPTHASMGFNQAWVFLTDVLPRAVEKHGGFDPEALRKAALETDIPAGGTIQGYGVKFYPPGHPMSGQNERSTPVVMQYVNGETKVVWPSAIKTADPVLPLPKGHAYAR